MSSKEEIEKQIQATLKNAKFPINGPQELLTAFPGGANTIYKGDSIELTVEAAEKILKEADFPLESPKEAAKAIVTRTNL